VTKTRSNSKQHKKWSKNLSRTLDDLVDTDNDVEELKCTTPKTSKKRKNMLRSPLPVFKKSNDDNSREVTSSKPPEQLILTVDSCWWKNESKNRLKGKYGRHRTLLIINIFSMKLNVINKYTICDLFLDKCDNLCYPLIQEIIESLLENAIEDSVYHETICRMCYGIKERAHNIKTTEIMESIDPSKNLGMPKVMMGKPKESLQKLLQDHVSFELKGLRKELMLKSILAIF
jgi:hypothetical protein